MALSSSKRMWAGNLEAPLWLVDNTEAMLVSVSCIVQYKQLIICTVESTVSVQLGPSPFCQPNNVHAKYTYSQINASLRDVRSNGQNGVRLRAIKSSGEECQTYHCQHNSMNIGDKSQTEKWGWSIKTKPIIAKPKAKPEDYLKTIVMTYQIWKYIIQSLTSLMTVHVKGH